MRRRPGVEDHEQRSIGGTEVDEPRGRARRDRVERASTAAVALRRRDGEDHEERGVARRDEPRRRLGALAGHAPRARYARSRTVSRVPRAGSGALFLDAGAPPDYRWKLVRRSRSMALDVFHQVLSKLHELAGGSPRQMVSVVDVLKQEKLFGSVDMILDKLQSAGWIADAPKAVPRLRDDVGDRGASAGGRARSAPGAVAAAPRARAAKTPEPKNAAALRDAASKARELATLLEELATGAGAPAPSGRRRRRRLSPPSRRPSRRPSREPRRAPPLPVRFLEGRLGPLAPPRTSPGTRAGSRSAARDLGGRGPRGDPAPQDVRPLREPDRRGRLPPEYRDLVTKGYEAGVVFRAVEEGDFPRPTRSATSPPSTTPASTARTPSRSRRRSRSPSTARPGSGRPTCRSS